MLLRLALLPALLLVCFSSLLAQDDMVLGLHQLTLNAQRSYTHPHHDVTVRCTFVGPNGQSYEVSGFWDGGSTWRVRFAPPQAGTWNWYTTASNQNDLGLNGVVGSFVVQAYTGTDPFRLHGWPRVSDNGRYLTYADGTPYFYLGDTAWEIVWKSTRDQVERYMLDRKKKGFNAVHVVASSHFFLPEYGIANQYGEHFFLDSALTLPNPRFYDYLDTIVARANELGMMIVMVPLWGGMCDVSENSGYHQRPLNAEKAVSLYAYISARYAGSNILWVVAADDVYDTPEEVEVRGACARALKYCGGDVHLCTIHPAGWRSSFYYFPDSTDWLDFHSYQPSHTISGDYAWSAPFDGIDRGLHKPLLNLECNYEDLYDNLWQEGDTVHPRPPRITATDVRLTAYESILSGALVGMSYGANGVWQWSQPWDMGYQFPRDVMDTALGYPGSVQIGVLADIMREVGWYCLTPRRELAVTIDNPEQYFFPVATNDTNLITYISPKTRSITIDIHEYGPWIALRWISPITGRVLRIDTASIAQDMGRTTIVPPDSTDWVLIVRRVVLDTASNPISDTMRFLALAPNPSVSGSVVMLDESGPSGRVGVTVVDAIGRVVVTDEVVVVLGQRTLPIPTLPIGSYMVRLRRLGAETGETWIGRLVVQ